MSELTDTFNDRNAFRRRLLATASAIALLGSANWMDSARAADGDADRPLVWIELGGQAEQLSGSQETFAPPFTSLITQNNYPSPTAFENNASWMIGGNGKISFQPEDSDWLFSASGRFGRANSQKSNRVQKTGQFTGHIVFSEPAKERYDFRTFHLQHTGYSYTKATASESYAVIDFQAGKDVGIGRIGGDGASEFGFGVRFAQFQSKSNVRINADPDFRLAHHTRVNPYYLDPTLGIYVPVYHRSSRGVWHALNGSAQSARSFHGIGPSISWNASSPMMGSMPDGELALDWGVNGAILFGRQRAQVHHQTTAQYHTVLSRQSAYTISSQNSADHARARTVVVPNVGGFAGWSFRYSNAKLSLGYRADFFFGAMDGGIDTAKKENVGFYGPFASVSVGLGG
ncbi:MAG TPA: hypothetical protein VIJ62_05370 [Rhizomicrobium sp.]